MVIYVNLYVLRMIVGKIFTNNKYGTSIVLEKLFLGNTANKNVTNQTYCIL